MLRYSDEEYNGLFNSTEWSREQTDQLLDLVEQFDRRFIIVADRLPGGKSIIDIQQSLLKSTPPSSTLFIPTSGFYEIQTALLKLRTINNLSPENNDIAQEPFDMTKELHRKSLGFSEFFKCPF